MAISVNWDTKVIYVPRVDMTLIQSVPTEIRSLDLNWFRLILKDLEDNVEGMPYLDTHRHNTEVSVGGVTLARVVEIINGYTVTFEDGQYAVNLVGANSNVADVVNVNQVSVRSANSAGLVTSQAIEFSEFGGCVTIDVSSSNSGTIYPIGTARKPVNNLADAILIAEYRGLIKLFIVGDFTFEATVNIEDYEIQGQGMQKTTITCAEGSSMFGCEIFDATVTGAQFGIAGFERCQLLNLTEDDQAINDADFVVKECIISGDINVPSVRIGVLKFIDCWSGFPPPFFYANGANLALMFLNYSGAINFLSITGGTLDVNLTSGKITLDTSITGGSITLKGVGILVNDSVIEPDVTGFISQDTIAKAVLDEDMTEHNVEASFGRVSRISSFQGSVWIDTIDGIAGTEYPIGTPGMKSNNITDAYNIAVSNGIKYFKVRGSIALSRDFDGYIFEGINTVMGDITTCGGFSLANTKFIHMTLSGSATGVNQEFNECILSNFSGINGIVYKTALSGLCTMGAAGSLILGSDIGFSGTSNILDMVGANRYFIAHIHLGKVTIKNAAAGSSIQLTLNYAQLTLDSSCTGGSLFLRGLGHVTNNSTMTIYEDKVINEDSIVDNIENTILDAIDIAEIKESVEFMRAIEEGNWEILGNQMIFYDTFSVEIARFNLFNISGLPTNGVTNGVPFKRERV